MSYTITRTDGTFVTEVSDGIIDTDSTSVALIGKNVSGYGDALNENFIRLLENSSDEFAPTSPMPGQLWWDSKRKTLKVCTDGTVSGFKTISSSTSQATAPTNPVIGDLWFDSSNNQLKVFNSTDWTLVGPTFSTTTGKSGAIVETITDTVNQTHVAVKIYAQDKEIAIFSKDQEYIPAAPPINGFSSIKPGVTLVSPSSVNNAKFYGQASDSVTLAGTPAANYARTDVDARYTANLSVAVDTGITIGQSGNFVQSVSGSTINITNKANTGNIALNSNIGGIITTTLLVDAGQNTVSVNNLSVASNVAVVNVAASGAISTPLLTTTSLTTGNIKTGPIVPDVANTRNIGSTTMKFANVYANFLVGTSVQAQYADLAERFESDAAYPAGTVVSIGGTKEITVANEELSEDVLGVISTSPAYLMNSEAGSAETHPAIALNGRVPVRVVGRINKGDRLVAAGNGVARSGLRSEISPFNVIGRSLQDKTSDGEGVILAIVKLNS